MREIAAVAGTEARAVPRPERRYLASASGGWLNVKREPSGVVVALPEFLRVEWEVTIDGRDIFVAREGVEEGHRFSVKSGNLGSGDPGYRGPVNLEFRLGRELLTYPGGQVRAITDGDNPVPLGVHPIQIPDFPHARGATYLGQTPYAKSWFYLGHGHALPGSGDRYLHPGSASAGCITVEPTQWTYLYRYLILCRSSDGRAVGRVTVLR